MAVAIAALAQALVASVEDEVRDPIREAPFGKGPRALIECLADGADRTRREAVSAKRLSDSLHFPRTEHSSRQANTC
jgi:hypothetical protein